jgi:phage tail sheath protein FI
MGVTVSYPGVYIEEFTPAPPIQGAPTSIVALLGPASSGPLVEPKLITSWDQFKQVFGSQPLPGFYFWYAAQGFFQNGGQLLYAVRISNAAIASQYLTDLATVNTIQAKAKQPGAAGNSLNLTVTNTSALNNLTAFSHAPTITSVSGPAVGFGGTDDAVRFRPGDIVIVNGDPLHRANVLTINKTIVTLSQGLPAAAIGQTLRLADLVGGQDSVVRFTDAAPDNPIYLTPGTYLAISDGGGNSETVVVKTVTVETITLTTSPPPLITYRVTFTQPVRNNFALAGPTVAVSHEFDLQIAVGAAPASESYAFLSMEPTSPRYYALQVNANSGLIALSPAQPPPPEIPYQNIPQGQTAALAGGADEDLGTLTPGDYQDGLDALLKKTVNIVAIPDAVRYPNATAAVIQGYLLDHCQGAPPHVGNRFAILDSRLGDAITDVATRIQPLASFGGFGALYYPWILIPPAPPPPGSRPPSVAPPNILVPPSGHVAGIYARIDNSRGVHKAPAGLEANIHGAIGIEAVLSDAEQGLLNMSYGVNVIRVFKGAQPTVWGARTTAVVASNTNWQYVNVRRLFLFLEASISEGIRFSVFEPNNTELWGKLKRSITAFLTRVWRDGALFGPTAKEAFYVRIDEVLNPPDQMALGVLTLEIGVRPAYPAEFVVVRIGIWDGGASITES